jgi:hypothetical protein
VDPLPALCIDHRKNLLPDTTQNDPPFLVVVAGNVCVLKSASVLEYFTRHEKQNPMIAQVGLSLYGIPIELHD